MLLFEDIKDNPIIKTYISKADESLEALGYTEHSFAHVMKVADTAKYILETLGYSQRDLELVQIAAYMHDIGNLVNRIDHAQSGAMMAFRVLDHLKVDPEDVATIVTAIGNHDETTAEPVNPIAAALIIADKTDVRRSRVRNTNITSFDIHDRVNYSVTKAVARISDDKTTIELILTIDTKYFSAMDYFEIFLSRMLLCRKSAAKLGMQFCIIVNGQKII